MSTASSRCCVIRHGETDWNAQRRIQGQVDTPLNAKGLAQARAAAEALAGGRFVALHASDLTRARQTAAVIATALGLEVRHHAALRERHHGLFQGHLWDEVATRFPEAHARFAARELDDALETGESLRALSSRVMGCLTRLAEAHAGEQWLVVTHGGVLDVLYREATGRGLETPRDFTIPNASLNWFERDATGWRLLAWNAAPARDALDDL